MKKVLNKIVVYWYILMLPIFIQCTEPSVIGLDVQPPSDRINVHYVDTLTVNAYTVREDSVRSDNTLYFLLGSLNDPHFGKSQASFCTQIQLPSSNIMFPEDITVDSMVLSLVVRGYYGNDKYINPINISVYEINDQLSGDSIYYSNRTVEKKTLIGNKRTVVNVKDSVNVNGSKLPPHVRISLDKNLAKRFIEDAAGGSLANNTIFTEYFRGILVESQPAAIGGTLFYFDLLSTVSNITIYYHTPDQSASFSFLINDKCARFNMFSHDYSSASSDFLSQLAASEMPSEKLYLQSRGGTKINISFPTIRNLTDVNNIMINKAELVFKIDESDFTTNIYPVPARLTLVKYNSEGNYVFIADQNSNNFGGDYDKTNKEFKFNIPLHIQNILKENTEDYGIALLISGASTRGDRVILHGMLHDELKPQLRLTYTDIY